MILLLTLESHSTKVSQKKEKITFNKRTKLHDFIQVFVVWRNSIPRFTLNLWDSHNRNIQMIEAKGENETVIPPHTSKLPDSILFFNMTLSNKKL